MHKPVGHAEDVRVNERGRAAHVSNHGGQLLQILVAPLHALHKVKVNWIYPRRENNAQRIFGDVLGEREAANTGRGENVGRLATTLLNRQRTGKQASDLRQDASALDA